MSPLIALLMQPGADPIDLLEQLDLGRPAWQRQAACRGQDPNIWFPERGDDVRPARAICDGCPVLHECQEWALSQGHGLHGIWAGTSPRQRRAWRKLRSARAA